MATTRAKRKASTAKTAAWGWLSKYVRAKAADSSGCAQCVTCGVRRPWQELHAGHFLPKKRGLAVYFLEENVHPQCPQCNTFNGGALIEYTQWMQRTYGEGIVDELIEISRIKVQMRLEHYEEIEAEYKEKFHSLGV